MRCAQLIPKEEDFPVAQLQAANSLPLSSSTQGKTALPSPLQQGKTKNPASLPQLASALHINITIYSWDTDLASRKKKLPSGAVIHQNTLQKFPKRTYSAQLTVTVGLNDILKSNQADYIMHQNMVKWYSFAAMLKEHLIFLRRNKAELSKYRQVKKEHERINGNFCSSYWCGKPCNTSESFPEAKGEM